MNLAECQVKSAYTCVLVARDTFCALTPLASLGVDTDFKVGLNVSSTVGDHFVFFFFGFFILPLLSIFCFILGMAAKAHVTRDETNTAWQLRDCQSCLFTEDPHREISIAALYDTTWWIIGLLRCPLQGAPV